MAVPRVTGSQWPGDFPAVQREMADRIDEGTSHLTDPDAHAALFAATVRPPVPANRHLVPQGMSFTTNTPPLDRPIVTPMVAPAQSWVGLACQVTTAGAAGAVARLGIYDDDGSGRPGTLIADVGTVDTTTTGLKLATGAFQTSGGLVWVVLVAQGATATYQGIGDPLDGSSWYGALHIRHNAYRAAAVAGALPTTLSLPEGADRVPIVALRA